jgi:hypothetical protein
MNRIPSLIENIQTCSSNSKNINCPELTPEQLDKSCYFDKNCAVICPENFNNNVIEKLSSYYCVISVLIIIIIYLILVKK